MRWLRGYGLAGAAAIILLAGCTSNTAASEGTPSPPTPTTPQPAPPSPSPTIPSLIGLGLKAARSEANGVGLSIHHVARQYSAEPQGTIVKQSLDPGAFVGNTGQINVTLSIYPKVPQLVGLSLAEARAQVKAVALRVTIRKIASPKPAGAILKQSIPVGKSVPAATKVRLTIVSPHLCGFPLNPWCFSVLKGSSVIYDPPPTLCHWLKWCLLTTWYTDSGYVVECNSGWFSRAGGDSGACSDYGGEWRPLLAP